MVTTGPWNAKLLHKFKWQRQWLSSVLTRWKRATELQTCTAYKSSRCVYVQKVSPTDCFLFKEKHAKP